MTVTLGSTTLYNAEESQTSTDGQTDEYNVVETDSDETILLSMTSQESVTYSGRVSGMRIAQDSSYSNDYRTALAEWVAEIETFVNGKQGSGYTLDDTNRGDTKNVVLDSVGWQQNEGEALSVSYDLAGLWAQGMMASTTRSPDAVSPSNSWSLAGHSLGGNVSHRQQKRQQLEYYAFPLSNPGEDEVLAESGAVRTVTIRGRVSDVEGSDSFDDTMQNNTGTNSLVTFSSAFPGRDLDVMIKSYDSFREAGWTQLGEYALELVEGIA